MMNDVRSFQIYAWNFCGHEKFSFSQQAKKQKKIQIRKHRIVFQKWGQIKKWIKQKVRKFKRWKSYRCLHSIYFLKCKLKRIEKTRKEERKALIMEIKKKIRKLRSSVFQEQSHVQYLLYLFLLLHSDDQY